MPPFEMGDLFVFPDDSIRNREINPTFLSGKYPEILPLAREIINKENEIVLAKNTSRNQRAGFETNDIITLLDVFIIIQRDE